MGLLLWNPVCNSPCEEKAFSLSLASRILKMYGILVFRSLVMNGKLVMLLLPCATLPPFQILVEANERWKSEPSLRNAVQELSGEDI